LNRFPITVATWFRAAGALDSHLINKYLNASWNGWVVAANPRPSGERSVYAFYLNPGANIIGDYGNPPFWANARIDDQAWHHVVLTVDATGGKLFLDGALVSERAWVGVPTPPTTTLPVTIGGDTREGRYFQGAIDDVVIYDRALSATEVQALFAADNEAPGETLYFASRSAAGRNFIGRIGPNGTVTELAGGFTGRINQLVAGPDGALYGANTDEHRIQRFGLDGSVSTWASGGLLSNPNGLAFDGAGNLLVANYAFPTGGKVIRIAPNGTMSVFSPLLGSGGGSLAFDAQGNLYAAEYIQNAITRITPAGVASTFQSSISSPTGLVFDAAGNLFVGNQGYGGSSPGITRITPAGVATRVGSGAPYNYVNGLALDEAGNLLATNAGGDNFLRVSPAGAVTVLATGTGSATGVAVLRNTFGTPWPAVWVRTGPAVAQGAPQFINGRFVNPSHWSADGQTWTPIAHPPYNHWLNNIGGGDGTFVLTGPQGQLWTSPDLATWTRRATPDNDDLTTVAHGNGVLLVRKFWQTGAMLRSADGGRTWATVATGSAPSRFYNELAFGQGRFVYALDRAVRTSVDGLAWQERAVPSAPAAFSFNQGPLVFDGVRFISAAVTASTATQRSLTVAISGDGLEWTFRSATLTTSRPLRLLGAGAGMIVVGGSDAAGSSLFLSRDDGATWTDVSVPPYAADLGLSGLVFAAGRAVLGGSAGFYTANASGLQAQTITFPPIAARVLGEAPFPVSAAASSGLPVALSVVSGPATLAGQTVTLTGAGTVVLRAVQGGNASYAPASAEQTFSVAKAAPVLQWNPTATVVQGTVLGSAQLNATATPAGGTFVYTPAAGVTLSTPGTQVLRVTYTPTAADSANYAHATLERTITVSAAPFVPGVQLSAEPTANYLAGGGNGTFRVRISYAGQTPSSLGVTVNLPAGWSFVSATAPASAAAPAPGSGVLEWAFATVPADELNFTFTAAYPAGQLGTKTLTGFATYRPGPLEVPFSDLQLAPVTAPTVLAAPASRLAAVQTGVVLTVSAAGTAPLTYRWLRNGVELTEDPRITGTGTASLSLANLGVADAGNYTVRVSNAAGSTTSEPAVLTVLDVRATHSLQGTGYAAGGTVTLAQTLTFADPPGALGWQMLVPAGWTYASGTGSEGEVRPVTGTAGLLEWAWTAVPASPVQFSVTLNVPFGTTGAKEIVALAIHRSSAGVLTVLARPDPLSLAELTYHSADTNRDYRFSLLELTRVIELYNARNGSTRTGAYGIATDSTEDGFYPDLRVPVVGPIPLPRYHSADINGDGRLSLLELTRVIEIFNYRAPGGSRTGEYHLHPGSEDGFNPGPLSVHPER
jgi:sugar lactone lactonase YvrE